MMNITKIIVTVTSVMGAIVLMLNCGKPLIQNTGALITAKFISVCNQKLENVNADINISFDEIGDMTLNELLNTVKVLASNETTPEEITNLYS